MFVWVSLVVMYVKVKELGLALKVFDESPKRNKCESILLWNVLINGCCKVGDLGKAVELFERMPERNLGSWNSLINRFIGNGDWKRAGELFEQIPEKNVVFWTTIVSGLCHNGEEEKALLMFFGMLDEGEYVYNMLQFSYGWYFTFVQGFVYLGLIYLKGFTTKQMVNPWKTYVKLSAVL
ncbi:hypothetical protein EZV62_011118 [Acer yangbiense]|uniref:Pentatricopeptide repeat-containing protein n=1 Tax=Acer yangbiense TaxID=1000413 RepID=A0A5C7I4V7_9ROSI|nr:hypothetical protein EZV62_011118 [Acer yangbiense]